MSERIRIGPTLDRPDGLGSWLRLALYGREWCRWHERIIVLDGNFFIRHGEAGVWNKIAAGEKWARLYAPGEKMPGDAHFETGGESKAASEEKRNRALLEILERLGPLAEMCEFVEKSKEPQACRSCGTPISCSCGEGIGT